MVLAAFLVAFMMPSKSVYQLFFLLFFILIVLFTTISISISSGSELKRTLIYSIYIILSVFVINKFLYKIDMYDLDKLLRLTLYLCILSVSIETILRFYLPTLDLRSDNASYIERVVDMSPTFLEIITSKYFYAYKFSSVMFFDSNFVGLFLLPVLILNLFYIEVSGRKLFKFLLVIVLLLIFTTFSRSAIITSIAVMYIYFLYVIMRWNKQVFILTLFLSAFIASLGLIYLYSILLQDGSLNTKLNILSSLNTVFDHDLHNILFGFGVDVGGTIYSYQEGSYAHALIPLLLGQFGLIGLAVYLTFLMYFSFKGGFFGWLLFFSIFTSGFSLADPWQILNYFTFLIMAHYAYLKKVNI